MNSILSHALKNNANQTPGKLLHILQYPMGNTPSCFPAIYYLRVTIEMALKLCAYVSETFPQSCQSTSREMFIMISI